MGPPGDNGSPLCPVASFRGKGDGELTTQPLNSVLNASFPVVLRKDLEIYSCADSSAWGYSGENGGIGLGVVRCAPPTTFQVHRRSSDQQKGATTMENGGPRYTP